MTSDPMFGLMTESETFVASLERTPTVAEVISGDANADQYIRFLVASYHYVRWSGFLLARTAEGLRQHQRCPELLGALDTKAREEGPHDGWVLRDLSELRVRTELIKGAAVPSAVRAYFTYSLALAEAGSPAFLGAAYTLEFISMRRATSAARNLRARRKIPNIERALRFLEGHGDADAGHVAKLDALLETVSEPRDRSEIAASAQLVRSLYPRFFVSDGAEVHLCCA